MQKKETCILVLLSHIVSLKFAIAKRGFLTPPCKYRWFFLSVLREFDIWKCTSAYEFALAKNPLFPHCFATTHGPVYNSTSWTIDTVSIERYTR